MGTLIALLVGEGQDWKSVEMPSGASSGAGAPTSAPGPSAPAFTGGSGMYDTKNIFYVNSTISFFGFAPLNVKIKSLYTPVKLSCLRTDSIKI